MADGVDGAKDYSALRLRLGPAGEPGEVRYSNVLAAADVARRNQGDDGDGGANAEELQPWCYVKGQQPGSEGRARHGTHAEQLTASTTPTDM